jgi:antitoxin CptB
MTEETRARTDDARGNDRIYWRSRRGMLELELQLLPFAAEAYPGLQPDEQVAYARLLEHDDWDLFDWLQGRARCSDPELDRLVARIRDFNQSRGRR